MLFKKIINKPPCLCAFSLGSLNLSTSADYIIPDFLPEYSIALHLYFGNDDCGNVICKKASFSLLKAVENEDHFVRVLPARELFESASADEQDALLRDVNTICQRCLGGNARISEIPEEIEIA